MSPDEFFLILLAACSLSAAAAFAAGRLWDVRWFPEAPVVPEIPSKGLHPEHPEHPRVIAMRSYEEMRAFHERSIITERARERQ